MKLIKISIDCKYKDKYLYKDDIIEPTLNNLEMIKKLNYGGFIEPLSRKEIEEIERNVKEEKHGKFSKEN